MPGLELRVVVEFMATAVREGKGGEARALLLDYTHVVLQPSNRRDLP
jgi:hypothetical protein